MAYGLRKHFPKQNVLMEDSCADKIIPYNQIIDLRNCLSWGLFSFGKCFRQSEMPE